MMLVDTMAQFSNSNWSAPVPGRSTAQSAEPLKIIENRVYESIAAAQDGRAPHFENTP